MALTIDDALNETERSDEDTDILDISQESVQI